MKPPTKVRPRGRPSTGRDPHLTSRMPAGLIERIEAWANANRASRSEALRRLVEIGLAHAPTARRRGTHKSAARASEMAAEELELLADQSATEEQKQKRKHRLLKGPT